MKIKALWLGLAGLLVAVLGASAQDAAGSAAVREFVIAYSPREMTLDPLHIYTTMESELCTAIYEGLLSPHPFTMEPLPGVAQNWEVSEDNRVYRFILRPEAAYSNGDPVRAQDFKAAWMRFLDPQARAEYSFFFDLIKGARSYRQGDPNAAVGIRVIDDHTLEVELEKPASHFLKLLTHLSFSPLNPRTLAQKDWDKAPSIIGNGPFYIVKRTRDELVLQRNELYWDRRNVELDRIRVRFIADPAAISDGFNLGEIHWASNWDNEKIKDSADVVFNPLFATDYFYFVCAQAPWNDARVRRGLALLVPWQEIRKGDRLFETSHLIPSFSGYPKVEGIDQSDPKEGLRLLAEAGYPGGRGLPPLRIKIADDPESVQIAGQMAQAWKSQVGLEVGVHAFDYEVYLNEVKKPDYELGSVTWIGDYADPLTFLQLWTRDSNLNDSRFSDDEYESLIETAVGQTDETARYRTLADAEQLLLQKAVVLPINHSPAFNLIDLKKIAGWYPNVLNVHPLKYVRFREEELPPGIAGISGGMAAIRSAAPRR